MNENRKAFSDFANLDGEMKIVNRINELAQQVKDGLITQAEADKIVERLAPSLPSLPFTN